MLGIRLVTTRESSTSGFSSTLGVSDEVGVLGKAASPSPLLVVLTSSARSNLLSDSGSARNKNDQMCMSGRRPDGLKKEEWTPTIVTVSS
ncbi:hypothetical protein M404DRAFT_1008926 [Pisolithus tinctorius Marx 270]|uniref:Uncharacterized protein n=1 Tax=Pisolithus tinctorius Marx 270 TaxID=870435 RepID=A0A0C3J6Y6_PISTI|nr:hypothetical protein M404DRAFT_1008926 [Pisolithus tinctorius Marx 270]